MKSFRIICIECNKDAELIKENDGGCSDPECCGGGSEWIVARCSNCGKEEIAENEKR